MARTRKRWALLAYVAGDNNLSRAGRQDIEELAKVGVNDNVHAAAEFDGRNDDFQGSIRYEFTERDPDTGRGYAKIIEHLDEKDSGDPQTFRNFLQWGIPRYPADNFLIVIWGHGHAFKDYTTRSVADDYQSGSSVSMRELRLALEATVVEQGIRFAILGFDSCVMSMLEVIYEVNGVTQYVVGSQQTERADGWPYNKVLEAMHESADAKQLGAAIIDSYIQYNKDHGYLNATQAMVATDGVKPAMQALDKVGAALTELVRANRDNFRTRLMDARADVQAFDASDYVDVMDLCQRFSTLIEIKVPIEQLKEAVGDCILKSASTDDLPNAHGLSIWFPAWRATLVLFRPEYAVLACTRDFPNWLKFLDTLYNVL